MDEVTAQQDSAPALQSESASTRLVVGMDRAVARARRVHPRRPASEEAAAATGNRPLETPLLLSGVRCTVRYIVLPFALPLLSVATGATFAVVTGAALGILLLLDVIAAISIIATLRRLWRLQHPRRWHYLPVALALAVLIGFFFVNDAGGLFA